MPEFLDHAIAHGAGETCIFMESGCPMPVAWKPAGSESIALLHDDGSDSIAILSPDALDSATEHGRILAVLVDREARSITAETWIDREATAPAPGDNGDKPFR